MNKLIFILIITLSNYTQVVAASETSNSELEFKGTRLNSDYHELKDKKALRGFFCMPINKSDKTEGNISCLKSDSIANEDADIFYRFYKFKLKNIHITSKESNYSQINDSLELKYGRPMEKSETVTTRVGVKYENVISTWLIGSSKIVQEKYGSKVTETSISFEASDYLDTFDEQSKSDASKGATDL